MTEPAGSGPGATGLRGVEIMTAFIDDLDSADLMFDLLEQIAVDERVAGVPALGGRARRPAAPAKELQQLPSDHHDSVVARTVLLEG